MAQLSNYEKAGRIVNDGAFINRVRASIIKIAIDVKGEVYTTRNTLAPDGLTTITVPSELSRKRSALADEMRVANVPNADLGRSPTACARPSPRQTTTPRKGGRRTGGSSWW